MKFPAASTHAFIYLLYNIQHEIGLGIYYFITKLNINLLISYFSLF